MLASTEAPFARGGGRATGAAAEGAVLLAFALPGAGPLDVVAGLPLVLRAVLTLKRAGLARIVVAAPEGPEGDAVERLLLGDGRARDACTFVRARDAASGLREAVAAAGGGPLLATAHYVVADPALFRALARARPQGGGPVATASPRGSAAGPVVVTTALLDAIAPALTAQGGSPRALEATIRAARERVLLTSMDSSDASAAWAFAADEPEGRRRAVDALFEACRKPVDGFVSRHLNRHVSIFVSKRLVDTRVTPNAMSVVTFAVALAGAALVARGGYGPMLAGAALMQANSILDGVDGELARVRFQHSHLGQWLDTVSDDLANLAFYAALAVASSDLPHGRELAWAGAIACGALLATMAQYYVELWRIGSGDFYALGWSDDRPRPGVVGFVVRAFERVLKKDFFLFLYLVLAVFGVLPFALVLSAFGHVVALSAATVRNLRRLALRAGARRTR